MRKLKPQLERIDIDELFNNSSNRGMLSFLERPPEEAQARLQEKQRVDVADSARLYPVGNLPPVGDSQTRPTPESPLPFPSPTENHPRKSGITASIPDSYPQGETPLEACYPLGALPPEVTHAQVRPLKSHSGDLQKHPEGKLPPGPVLAQPNKGRDPKAEIAFYPEGDLPTGRDSPLIDGSVVGRRQKIRRASVAQDGHSSGEQLLYQSLWNAARTETQETRLLCVGYNGMSALCKLDRSNCKKNILSLIEKLSLQVAETYESASSTGTTYRIFSYKEILRRREAAGMVWVIRTSGVRFVNPLGNLPTLPIGYLPSDPGSVLPIAPVSKTPIPPVGETPTPLGKNRNPEGITTSALVHEALSAYGAVDDEALARLIRSCQDQAPDCTMQEIVHFIHEKGRLVRARENRIKNPIGFLIDAVPKCFVGETFRLWRQQGREDRSVAEDTNQAERDREWGREHEAQLEDPGVPEGVKAFIRKCLGTS